MIVNARLYVHKPEETYSMWECGCVAVTHFVKRFRAGYCWWLGSVFGTTTAHSLKLENGRRLLGNQRSKIQLLEYAGLLGNDEDLRYIGSAV